MAETRGRFLPGLVAACLTALLLAPTITACPFCVDERGPTLVGEFQQASMVLYGSFVSAKLDAAGGTDNGTSEFKIDQVLKAHPILNNKKILTLPKYIPASNKKFIVFCDVYKNYIEPYKGEELLVGSELLDYLNSMVKLAEKEVSVAERLRHCFKYLNCADLTVSTDAYREFAKADYADYRDMAKKLPADTLAEWLEDAKTPAYRYGLYASLLGHCGDAKKHGVLLRNMIDDPKKRQGSGIDGMMAGYVMLEPKEGWKHLQHFVKNEKEDFYVRYAVLRTMRFFWDNRNDVLSKKDILHGMSMIIQLHDLADFAIDDLRQWQAWTMTDQVLDLFAKDSHRNPIIQRAILRFALCSPAERAKTFVVDQRKRDPVWVSDTEGMLKFEPAPKVQPPAAK
jgi:hypothetical protein